MTESLLSQLFPTPSFLVSSSVGLELSDSSITFAELVRKGGKLELGRYGTIPLPLGVIQGGIVQQEAKLASLLEDLKKKYSLKNVRLSLPDDETYFFELSIPRMRKDRIDDIIRSHIGIHTPFQSSEVYFDYVRIEESESKTRIRVVATSSQIVDSYLSACKHAGLSVLSCEPKSQALARSLIKKGDGDTFIIVDFKEKETQVSFVSNESVFSGRSVPLGGQDLTAVLENHFNISQTEATRRKRVVGLSRKNEHLEISSQLLTGAVILKKEIYEELALWSRRKDKDGKPYPPVAEIILTGPEANVPGLAEYLSSSLRLKTRTGNPWSNINTLRRYAPEIHARDVGGYAAALGLALHDYE